MALTFKFDDAQLAALIQAINDLSHNIGKWQAQQTGATEQGFSDLVRTLGGTGDEQLQTLVNDLAVTLNLSTDQVEAAIKQSQQKG
jgi:hypothetical protein